MREGNNQLWHMQVTLGFMQVGHDQPSAKLEIFGYIEGFYNTKRTHSALGYKTPKQIEEMLLEKKKMAA